MIYLDNAASTRPAPEVLAATRAVEEAFFANPSSAHGLGAAAARALEAARGEVAAALGAEAGEIVFTGGGTEANALGLLGAARAARGRHVVIGGLEHPAVARTAARLAGGASREASGEASREASGEASREASGEASREASGDGYTLTVVAPGRDGVVRAADVLAATRPDTALVALMLVNNELGTIQPVDEVARGLAAAFPEARRRPHLHVDAVQAFGLLRVRPRALGADTLALSSHKVHGPKGVGALWVRAGARLEPLWDGGRQERGLRSGTENVAVCVGLGRAAGLAVAAQDAGVASAIERERDRLERACIEAVPGVRPTVTGAPRAPHIASLAFPGLPAEPLLHALEARDVYVSAGSACASRTRGPSAVLKAIGLDDRTAVLRFSLARTTTPADVDAAVDALRGAVAEISPLARIS
ncbi:MAG TPA: cysteine desulfurase family protein [Polyangia bacterium]|nr:cysteine desulfurase family protein [Polyangia bacterium]